MAQKPSVVQWAWWVPCGPGLLCFIGSPQLESLYSHLYEQLVPERCRAVSPQFILLSVAWLDSMMGHFESHHFCWGSDFTPTIYLKRHLCHSSLPSLYPRTVETWCLWWSVLRIDAVAYFISKNWLNSSFKWVLFITACLLRVIIWIYFHEKELFEAFWKFIKMDDSVKILEPCSFYNVSTKHIRYLNVVFTW